MEFQAAELKRPLRPMEQTSLWTFSSALTLLQTIPEDYISDALDEFLIHNNAVLLAPEPFAKRPDSKPVSDSTKEFTLRGVLYSGVTSENIKMARKIAALCQTDELETLRVIVQTKARVPEYEPLKKSELNSRLPDEGAVVAENQKALFYTLALLTERRTVLALASECFNNRYNDQYLVAVRNVGQALVSGPEFVISVIDTLAQLLAFLSRETENSGELDQLVSTEKLLLAVDLLKLLCDIHVSPDHVNKKVVNAWFKLAQKLNFAVVIGPYVSQRESFTLVQALFTIVSLELMDLKYDFAHPDNALYLEDGDVFTQVNDAITGRDSNSIIRYAWLILVYKKSIILSDVPKTQQSFLSVVSVKTTQLSLSFLQENVEIAPVFQEIRALSSFLRFDDVYGVTLTNLVTVALPLLVVNPEIAACIAKVLIAAPNSCVERFFDDEFAQSAIVLARAKFPLLMSPYLNLASINGNFALHELTELKLYISLFNRQDFGSKYDIDLENTDLVKVTDFIDLFPPYEQNNKLSFVINAGTKAKLLNTGDDLKVLVSFLHNYNGWAFLGRVLQNISRAFDINDDEKLGSLLDIVDLLVSVSTTGTSDELSTVLEYMSAYTDDSDIVEVLFRLFEQALHNRSVELSEKLLQVFSYLTPVISTRIWPYLSTSSLLSNRGKEGFLSILFGSIEMVRGDYRFTINLVKFVFSLSENCLSVHDDYPIESKGEILARLIEHLLLVFESYNTCKFNDGLQKLELGLLILDVFRQTLETIHCIDLNVPATQKPTKVFARASERILDAFLFTNSTTTRSASSILHMIDSLAATSNFYEAIDVSGYFAKLWIRSALNFSKLLVTIRLAIDAQPSRYEKELFSKLPNLVQIYSRGGSFRKPILDLITALTNGKWEKEPMPSMLSHLGRDNSRIFLHSLAVDLDNAFDDYAIKISIYDLLCAIMEANQQGLAVLFISGRHIFGEFGKEKKEEDANTVSLLSILKKNVNEIKYYPETVTVHLLDAIALAFNSWTTTRDGDSDVAFVKELVSMLGSFKKTEIENDNSELIFSSYQCKLYAKVSEILSLVLFSTKNEKCKLSITDLLGNADFLEKLPLFFTIFSYKSGLYEQVNARFEAAFAGSRLSQFSVALQKRNRFGVNAVYDLLLMDSLFQKNTQWPEIRQQVIRSSANIQLYNAQVALAKAMGALVTTYCRKAVLEIGPGYFKFASQLLTVSGPDDSYTKRFISQQYLERIELSFLIAFTLNGIETYKKDPSLALDIIESCGELLASSALSFEKPTKEFTCKSLLRLIYVALSILKGDFELLLTRFSVLRDVFNSVVAKGTKNIIIELQNDVYLSRTDKKHVSTNFGDRLDDLKLILTIFKSFLALKISSSLQEELAECLASHGTIDILLSLYSFSHLILVNDEPIFAQLSLMFIQQLLSVDVLAEKFVGSNMFIVIRESVISIPLRNGGVTVENAPQIHRNWANGILPILVGALARNGIDKEIFLTLRAFSKQIESCIEGWARDSSSLQVSSAATWETTQIMFIYRFLSAMAKSEGYVAVGSSEVDMPLLPGLDTQQKRDDFVDYINNLLKHPKFLSSRIVASTPEEAATLASGDVASQALVSSIIEDIGELKEFLN